MKVILKDVRLAFPQLFVPKPYAAGQPERYSVTLLAVKGSENDSLLQAAVKEVAQNKWDKKAEKYLKDIANDRKASCLRDGDKEDLDGFAGCVAVSAHRYASAGAPAIVDADNTPLDGKQGRPYSGCYVHAHIELWAQDNPNGRGIRATLVALRFSRDGEAFGGTPPADASALSDLTVDI